MTDTPTTPPTSSPSARLAAHAAECEECRLQPLPLARIAAALDQTAATAEVAPAASLVLARVRPVLQQAAQRLFWRRVSLGLLLSLLPLPLVLAYDALLLRFAYQVISTVLPETLSLLVVANYVALLALLIAVTYAAIPLLAARRRALPLMLVE